jgi:hypothetical protein
MHSTNDPRFRPMNSARPSRAPLQWALKTGSFSVALLATCYNVGVAAQDAVPETQGELKDFRLDTPTPKEKTAEPAPPPISETPKPKVEAPIPVQQPKGQERTVSKPAAAPEAKTAVPKATSLTDPKPDDAAVDLAPPIAETVTKTPDGLVDADPVAKAEPAVAAANFNAAQYWPLGLGLLGLLLVLGGFVVWRKKRPASQYDDVVDEVTASADLIDDGNDSHVEEIAPLADLPAAASTAPAPVVAALAEPTPVKTTVRRVLSASFEPAEARLSLTNLTVTGCLRMRYESPDPLETLQMRSQVISACEGQQAMIDAFHADSSAGQVDSLGPVQPGEEIVLTLELQVPREGLQAFDWRERRFIAPILLLNIGSDNSEIAPVIINCLVGQQGNPASNKMRPLAIDRGPRLYGDLRFQPLAA